MKIKQKNLFFILNEKDRTAAIVDNAIFDFEALIPNSIEYQKQKYIITSLSKKSFCDYGPRLIQIPWYSNLRTIEKKAFFLSPLEIITIPPSVSELKEGWCDGAFKLTKVIVMDNNPYFKNYENNEHLVVGKSNINDKEYDILIFVSREIISIEIPPNIKRISSYSLEGRALEKIFIPSKVTHICKKAFNICHQLKNVDFAQDSELQIIDKYAFFGVPIKNIIIPSNVTFIGENAFATCNELQNFEISPYSKLQTIGEYAFTFSNVCTISIPSNILNLKCGWCFLTEKLKKIKIIEEEEQNISFYDDEKYIIGKSDIMKNIFDILILVRKNISSVTIPLFIKKIDSCAFSDSLIEYIFIPPNVTCISSLAFYQCEKIRTVEISPDSQLRTIDSFTFLESSIETLTIPPSVSELKEGWCEGTEKLTEVIIMPGNPYFKNYENDSNLVIGKSNINDKEYDILIFASRKIKEVQIPPSIKKISSYSFENSKIEKISIPKEIIQIGQYAFHDCDHLHYVDIPTDSKLQLIGMYSLYNTSIERFFIPNQIIQIDKNTFNDKLIVIEITNNSKLQILNENSFSSSLIENIFIPRSVTRICKFAFYNCRNLRFVDILFDSELQIIEKSAFQKTSIKSIFIPSNVIKIDESSFKSCDSLQIIEFGENSNIQTFILSKFMSTLKYNQQIVLMLPQKFRNNFI